MTKWEELWEARRSGRTLFDACWLPDHPPGHAGSPVLVMKGAEHRNRDDLSSSGARAGGVREREALSESLVGPAPLK
jgi:hypothetical protein